MGDFDYLAQGRAFSRAESRSLLPLDGEEHEKGCPGWESPALCTCPTAWDREQLAKEIKGTWYEVVETFYVPGRDGEAVKESRVLLETDDLGEAQRLVSQFRTEAPLRDVRLERAVEDGNGAVGYERIR